MLSLGCFLLLLLIGVPIAVSLGLSSIVFLLVFSDTSLASIAQSLYQAMAGHYTLLAIPFFIFAANLMGSGQIARQLIGVVTALVGHTRGGIGHVVVGGSMEDYMAKLSIPLLVAATVQIHFRWVFAWV